MGCLGSTGGDDDCSSRATSPASVSTSKAGRCLAHAGDGGVLDDRRVDVLPVAVEPHDQPGCAQVSVGIVAAVVLAGEPGHPVGCEQPE